jgi:hypothetical protein
VTFTDPAAFAKPLSIGVNMELAADTAMLEAVCEARTDHWVGSFSASQKAAVRVAPELLQRMSAFTVDRTRGDFARWR